MSNLDLGDDLLIERQGAVAVLTLNRPHRLNALDATLIGALMDALDRIEADDAVRALVLTGAGQAFSAGADIHAFAPLIEAGPAHALQRFVRRGQGLTRRIESYPKPLIAAVNGLAFGGGCEVVEAAALAIASERARFAKPEIALGFPPPFGGSQRLPRHVGRKRALALILTGDAIDAAEAERIGLVNRVVPHEALREAALALADRILAHDDRAIRACLHAVTRGLNLSIDEGLAVEAEAFARSLPHAGVPAGVQRFLDRARGRRAAAGR